jgi:hypothetical protein
MAATLAGRAGGELFRKSVINSKIVDPIPVGRAIVSGG